MYSTIGTICCRTQFEDTAEFPTTEGTLVADRYRIESFLGSAAFSNCVRATDLNAQKSVCLNIIKTTLTRYSSCVYVCASHMGQHGFGWHVYRPWMR
jgi:hypothetical protein